MTATVPGQRLILADGDARLEVAPELGGRFTSFTLGGDEILVTSGPDPIHWGCFPMVPFAGRIREGRFRFDGRTYRLPPNLPPNAIHGTVHERAWSIEDDRTIAIDLGPDWPFAGRVAQRFDLTADRLLVTLELQAAERMPAALGWHPWFRRRLDGAAGRAQSPEAELQLEAAVMLERDADGIASRRRLPPSSPPWDDCFTELRSDPVIEWPGVLALRIASSARYWVVYSELPHALCVEPQTAPPDDVNHDPLVLEADESLVATMEWRWHAADSAASRHR